MNSKSVHRVSCPATSSFHHHLDQDKPLFCPACSRCLSYPPSQNSLPGFLVWTVLAETSSLSGARDWAYASVRGRSKPVRWEEGGYKMGRLYGGEGYQPSIPSPIFANVNGENSNPLKGGNALAESMAVLSIQNPATASTTAQHTALPVPSVTLIDDPQINFAEVQVPIAAPAAATYQRRPNSTSILPRRRG